MSFAGLIESPRHLAHRLSWLYGLLFSCTLVIALFIGYQAAGSLLRFQEKEDLVEDLEDLNRFFDESGLAGVKNEIRKELLGGEESQKFFIIYDHSGEYVFASDLTSWQGMHEPPSEFLKQAALEAILEYRTFSGQEYPTAMISGALGDNYIIALGESTEEHQEIMALLLQLFLSLFLIVVPITSLGGWLVARRAVRDLGAVNEAAKRITHGELDARVRIAPNAVVELSGLADTFNQMAETVEKVLAEMREITDNVAHDLRSPITRVRVICETALTSGETMDHFKTAAEDTLIECDRLISLINSTLEVSEIESGVHQPPKVTLSFSRLVEDACDLYEPVAELHQVAMNCKTAGNCEILGQRYSLQRMLSNLIDNAIKYSSAGQTIDVVLASYPDFVELQVTDHGVGIAPEEIDKVFNRFYRCSSDRSQEGCGLGLSFARAVARYHGGDIRLKSEVGCGSTFSVILPKMQSQVIEAEVGPMASRAPESSLLK